MNDDTTKKTCRMCRMEIPKEARKCPFCLHFQKRGMTLAHHHAFAVMLATLPFAAIWIISARIFDPGEEFELYKNQIVITESTLAFGQTKSDSTVAIVGTIKNTSPVPWKHIHFHADFFGVYSTICG